MNYLQTSGPGSSQLINYWQHNTVRPSCNIQKSIFPFKTQKNIRIFYFHQIRQLIKEERNSDILKIWSVVGWAVIISKLYTSQPDESSLALYWLWWLPDVGGSDAGMSAGQPIRTFIFPPPSPLFSFRWVWKEVKAKRSLLSLHPGLKKQI